MEGYGLSGCSVYNAGAPLILPVCTWVWACRGQDCVHSDSHTQIQAFGKLLHREWGGYDNGTRFWEWRGCDPGTRCVPPDITDHQALSLTTEFQGGVLNFSTDHSVCHCSQRDYWSLHEEAMWWTVCFLSGLNQKELCKTTENVTHLRTTGHQPTKWF